MSKKNKKKSKDKKILKEFNKEILGSVIFLLGFISMISLFSKQMGIFGKGVRFVSFKLMGLGAYLLPLMIMIIGIIMISDSFKGTESKYIILLLILILIILIGLDSVNIGNGNFIERIKEANEQSTSKIGGGIIGAFFGFFFYKLLGKVGGFIVLATMTLIVYMIGTDTSLMDLGRNIKSLFKKDIKNNKRKKKKKLKNKEPNIKDHSEEVSSIHKTKESNTPASHLLDSFNAGKDEDLEDKSTKDKKTSRTTPTNKKSLDEYEAPPLELLNNPVKTNDKDNKDELREKAKIIEDTLLDFNIEAQVTQINRGPTITSYEVLPAPGVKVNRILSLSDNLALSLAASGIRIEAPIPGKSAVGIEVPNINKDSVLLKEMILSKEFKNLDSNIPLTLGKDVTGKPIISTIDKMPHLLIAGATGSGKSVCINTIITSIIYKSSPEETKLLLIDPKVVELSVYNDIPHLLIPVVTDPQKATFALNQAVKEMEDRYKKFAETKVRDIKGYNKKFKDDKMPNLIIIIDELADLMMVAANEVEEYIARLAQMARAAGIYLILATQRPSVDVITGTIKANIPSRISFSVSSAVDSRTILDEGGAEKLLGQGDMLFYPSSFSKPQRIQGAFISDEEVEDIVNFLKNNHRSDYDAEIVENLEKAKDLNLTDTDPLINEAIKMIIMDGQASISMLQRRLNIGYNRARTIVDDLESQGIVGPAEGTKPRDVLVGKDFLENLDDIENNLEI